MSEIFYKEESYSIIGACMSVHNDLGPGFLEAVYQEALEREFTDRDIPFSKEVKLKIFFKNLHLSKFYRADFICYNAIMLEVKVSPFIYPLQLKQLSNYLKATGMELGILVNFGQSSLTYKRVVNITKLNNSQ